MAALLDSNRLMYLVAEKLTSKQLSEESASSDYSVYFLIPNPILAFQKKAI